MKENGYLEVALYKNGVRTPHLVHRLLAEAFIPNPENKPYVNHKSEIKTENNIDNLEWVTPGENNNYGTRTLRTCKPVYCIELDRIFYGGASEAARELDMKNRSNINAACKGKRKTAGGYHWRYVNG